MPSSTSSFDRPFRVIVTAFLLAVLIAAGWDGFWRRHGFPPALIDDLNLWSIWRRQANAGPRVLAVAGSSRLLMGLHLDTLRTRFPNRQVIQLSINSGSPLAILEDLANDKKFQGGVLCEILPHQAYANPHWTEDWAGYHDLPWAQRLEAPLHLWLAGKTNLVQPDIAPRNVLTKLLKDRCLPKPNLFHIERDRQGGRDFSRLTPAELATMREGLRKMYDESGKPLNTADFDARIQEIRRLAELIRNRGGQVVFFRMISSSPVQEIQQTRFPDAAYWNLFQQKVGFPCLNFTEVPALTKFECPEGAHLDQRDLPAFTNLLSDALIERNLLR